MKRKSITAIIILLVITATLFAACNQTPTTDFVARFDNTEHYEFAITLADFGNSLTEPFAHYGTDDDPYYKDLPVSAAENYSLRNADEIRPDNVCGTYIIDFAQDASGNNGTLTTQQTLYAQYTLIDNKIVVNTDPENPEQYEFTAELNNYAVSGADDPLQSDENHITLKSVTDTSVTFALSEKFRPSASSTVVNGFYIGKIFRGASEYSVKTTYNWDEKRPVAEVTRTSGNETTTESYNLPSATVNVIDSNQILAYLRCLNKSSTSFQDAPSAYVFNPYTAKTHLLRFSFGYSQNIIVTRGSEDKWTKLNAVGALLDGNPLLMQFNLPDKLFDDNLDIVHLPSKTISKFTMVAFRSGYLSYKWSDCPDEIWQALDGLNTDSEQK